MDIRETFDPRKNAGLEYSDIRPFVAYDEKGLCVARLAKEMFGVKVRMLTGEDVRKRGYGRKVFELLNLAYSPLFGYTELTDRQIEAFVRRYLPLVDKRML